MIARKLKACKQCGKQWSELVLNKARRGRSAAWRRFEDFCSPSCYSKFKNKQPDQVKRNKTLQLWRREARPKTFILYRARSGAKARGIACTLILKDIPDIPEFCSVFPWIRLEYKVGVGRFDGSPSLDRIDNKRGYEAGNVRIISDRANSLKSDATQQELIALGVNASKQRTCNETTQRLAARPGTLVGSCC